MTALILAILLQPLRHHFRGDRGNLTTTPTYIIECDVIFRTSGPGSGAQVAFCMGGQNNGALTLLSQTIQTASFDPTVSQPVLFQAATQVAAGDVFVDGYTVELIQ